MPVQHSRASLSRKARRRALILFAAGLMLPASPADAAHPRGGADFGGGTAESARVASLPNFVALRTSGGAHKLSLLAELNPVDCSGEVRVTAQHVSIASDGSFHEAGTINETAVTGHQVGTFVLDGRFTDSRHAAGTARAQVAQSANGGTQSCDTGVVHWRAASPARRSGSGKRSGSVPYYGHTSQRSRHAPVKLPFLMKTSNKAKMIATAAAETESACPGHHRFTSIASGGFLLDFIPIKHGAFHAHATFSETRAAKGKRYRVRFTFSVLGHFGTHEASGTWRTVADIYRKSDGAHVARCSSPKLHWVAAR